MFLMVVGQCQGFSNNFTPKTYISENNLYMCSDAVFRFCLFSVCPGVNNCAHKII